MAIVTTTYFNFNDIITDIINNKQTHYFNCKRCGATGQVDICEYCGSADDEKGAEDERLD